VYTNQLHTDLLHRMLVARHFAERGVPVPVLEDLDFLIGLGEEAVLIGLSAALAPTDALVRHHPPAGHVAVPGSLVVCVHERPGRFPVSFRPAAAGAEPAPAAAEAIDGLDVEAVLAGARRAARAVRSGGRTRLMELDVTGPADPIEILTVRMRAAHELDDNALRAIDGHATRQVLTALG
jgi:TPP-dependent pyruvate/acetoin dehydrogenase alpha subunit